MSEQLVPVTQTVWALVERGQHALVMGELDTPPKGWMVLEIDCAAPGGSDGPLLQASRELERIALSTAPLGATEQPQHEQADSAGYSRQPDSSAAGTPPLPGREADTRLGTKSPPIALDTSAPFGTAAVHNQGHNRGGAAARLLDELDVTPIEVRFVEAGNLLAANSQRPSALVLKRFDQADEPTKNALIEVLAHPGWLALPLVLQSQASAVDPALASAIESAGGKVIHAHSSRRPPVQDLPQTVADASHIETPAGGSDAEKHTHDWTWQCCSPAVLRVLRAAATIGPRFEAGLLAQLLGLSQTELLERLQRAADEGAPLSDGGDGHLALPDSVAAALRTTVLPSLLSAWHRELARLMSPPDKTTAATRAAASHATMARNTAAPMPHRRNPPVRWTEPAAAMDRSAPGVEQQSDARSPAEQSALPARARLDDLTAYADVFAPAIGTHGKTADARQSNLGQSNLGQSNLGQSNLVGTTGQETGAARTTRPADYRDMPELAASPDTQSRGAFAHGAGVETGDPSSTKASGFTDSVRAARHLLEAGRADAAANTLLDAAREKLELGDARTSASLLNQARSMAEHIRSPGDRSLVQARSQICDARLRWTSPGLAADDRPANDQSADERLNAQGNETTGYTLQQALESIERARQQLPADAPSPVILELATLYAGIAYDLGDSEPLQSALELLATASRALLARGDALSAAYLLNDQAAINLRLGDPVQAVHLLKRAREVFQHLDKSWPDLDSGRETLQLALAQTEHLLARLPLHAPSRPGREQEALQMALSSAQQAQSTLARLNRPRERARIWETIARLRMMQGDLQGALTFLARAVSAQQHLGDATGLARSCSAYTELLISAGQPEQAMTTLAQSVALNYRKGSRAGLAFNRQALEALAKTRSNDHPEQQGQLQLLKDDLDRAEQILGRARLPWQS